jgi:calcium/calmodulin-dependent protein kinase I
MLKIVDFGLGIHKMQTEEMQYCGTRGYIAPEVFLNQKYDEKIDIFSLGIIISVLYFLPIKFYHFDKD